MKTPDEKRADFEKWYHERQVGKRMLWIEGILIAILFVLILFNLRYFVYFFWLIEALVVLLFIVNFFLLFKNKLNNRHK